MAAPTRTGRSERGGLRRRPPDRLEDRLDVRRDELAVPADPGTAELERDGHGVVVRRARRRRSPPGRPAACGDDATAPAPPARRRGCRGRRPTIAARVPSSPSTTSTVAQSSRSLPSEISWSWLPQPPAGIPTGGVMSARPTPARMRLTAAAGRSSAGRRTPSGGRRPRAARRRAGGRGAARPRCGPSRRCPDGRRRRPAGRDP